MPIGGNTGSGGIILVARRGIALEVLINHFSATIPSEGSGMCSVIYWGSDGTCDWFAGGWVNHINITGIIGIWGPWDCSVS